MKHHVLMKSKNGQLRTLYKAHKVEINGRTLILRGVIPECGGYDYPFRKMVVVSLDDVEKYEEF